MKQQLGGRAARKSARPPVQETSGVLVDNQLNILEFLGDTGAYLQFPHGKASFNLRAMARAGHAARTVRCGPPGQGERGPSAKGGHTPAPRGTRPKGRHRGGASRGSGGRRASIPGPVRRPDSGALCLPPRAQQASGTRESAPASAGDETRRSFAAKTADHEGESQGDCRRTRAHLAEAHRQQSGPGSDDD